MLSVVEAFFLRNDVMNALELYVVRSRNAWLTEAERAALHACMELMLDLWQARQEMAAAVDQHQLRSGWPW